MIGLEYDLALNFSGSGKGRIIDEFNLVVWREQH